MAKEIAPAKEFTSAPVEAVTEPSWVNEQTEAPAAPVSENWADDVVQAPAAAAAAPVAAVAAAAAPAQAFASSGDWASQVIKTKQLNQYVFGLNLK